MTRHSTHKLKRDEKSIKLFKPCTRCLSCKPYKALFNLQAFKDNVRLVKPMDYSMKIDSLRST